MLIRLCVRVFQPKAARVIVLPFEILLGMTARHWLQPQHFLPMYSLTQTGYHAHMLLGSCFLWCTVGLTGKAHFRHC